MNQPLSYRTMLRNSLLAGALSLMAIVAQAQTASPFGFEDNTTNGWMSSASSETVSVNSAAANVRTGTYSLKLSTTSTGTGSKQWYGNNPFAASASGVYIHFVYWAKAQDANTSADASFRYASTTPPTGAGSSANASTDVVLSTTAWKRVTNVVTTSSSRYYFAGPRKTVSSGATALYLDDGIIYTSASGTTDTIKPLAATALTGTVSGNLVTLNWTSNTDAGVGASGVAATIILRTANLTAAAPELNDQAAYSTTGSPAGPNTVGDWTVISSTTGHTATTYMDATPSPSGYKYAVVLRDLAHNYSIATISPTITAGTPVPTILINQTSFNGNLGNTLKTQFSAESSYTINGLNLTAPITITAPTGFQVSTTTGTGFATSLTLAPTLGVVNPTNIYVRFAPINATGATGNQNITNVSASAGMNVIVSGNAIDLEPATTGSISFGVVRSTRIAVNLPTVGSGSKRIIVISNGVDVSYIPVDGVAPTGISADYNLATDQGSGNKIVYDGNGVGNDVVLVTGLIPGTTYYFAVYEYNVGTGTSQNYLPNSPITALARTADNDLSVGNTQSSIVKIFPNPTTGKVYFGTGVNVAINIRGMDGRLVFTGRNVKEVDLSNVAAGIYLVQLTDEKGRLLQTERLVVNK